MFRAFRSRSSAALAAAFLLPAFAVAQDGGTEPCAYPVQLLWHAPSETAGQHRMGVSVRSQSGQQVPNLGPEVFQVIHQGALVTKDDSFKVTQSKEVLVAAAAGNEKAAESAKAMASDPINYDVYFAVDLTKSMGDETAGPADPVLGGRTKKLLVAEVIKKLTAPDKEGNYALFDENDRVYISGFTEKVEIITEAPTANREKLVPALGTLAQFEVDGEFAAFYPAVLHNLDVIRQAADQYKDPAKNRQAILIAITDSFNGIDTSGRRLRGCNDNGALNDTVRQALIDTRTAVGGQFKLYVMGLGKLGENDKYRLKEDHHRYCRIDAAQKEFLDGKSLAAIGRPEITNGGGLTVASDPVELARWLLGHFEALKTAYEISYTIPKDKPDASLYKAAVTILDTTCEGSLVEANQFIRQATKKASTSPSEVALFLGSLLLTLLFLPRTFMNLGNLGGKDSAPQKKKKPATRKKKRK